MPTGNAARDRELDPRKLTRQDALKFCLFYEELLARTEPL
jgi:hypothetical protein